MSDKTKEKVKCTIPIKVNSYEELFNPLDYRNLAERDINGEVHSWIEEYISRVPQKLSSINVELLINMPEDAMDKDKEEKSKLGIINYYNSFFILVQPYGNQKNMLLYIFCINSFNLLVLYKNILWRILTNIIIRFRWNSIIVGSNEFNIYRK